MGTENRVTVIRVGEEKVVMIEDLLMKLGLARTVVERMEAYIAVVEGDGDCSTLRAPDAWAITGALQTISEISHALKSACWGHEAAHKH